MKVNIKKLNPEAVVPKYASNGDAGLDLTAVSEETNSLHSFIEYGTGLAIEIPQGHVGLIFPRSSISKQDLSLANSVGVIDSGYRGEIKIRMRKSSFNKTFRYEVGDRVAQLVIIPYPQVELNQVDELSDTVRGDGGFGSTGMKGVF